MSLLPVPPLLTGGFNLGSAVHKATSSALVDGTNRRAFGFLLARDGTEITIIENGQTSSTSWRGTMSTPFDISTLTDSDSFELPGYADAAHFVDSGTQILSGTPTSVAAEFFALSTAFDPSSAASPTSGNLPTAYTRGYGLRLSDDGTKLRQQTGDRVITQHTLSTPFDLTTASSDGSIDLSATLSSPAIDFVLNRDETRMLVLQPNPQRVFAFRLSTPGDVTSAVDLGVPLDFSGQLAANANRLEVSPLGDNLYIVEPLGKIAQYGIA